MKASTILKPDVRLQYLNSPMSATEQCNLSRSRSLQRKRIIDIGCSSLVCFFGVKMIYPSF